MHWIRVQPETGIELEFSQESGTQVPVQSMRKIIQAYEHI